tara:strand:+ start:168 stop:299 length:132 start_codon:yes stop_codon:yes gene_type:complete
MIDSLGPTEYRFQVIVPEQKAEDHQKCEKVEKAEKTENERNKG